MPTRDGRVYCCRFCGLKSNIRYTKPPKKQGAMFTEIVPYTITNWQKVKEFFTL